jgi:exodeoxyribonuclease VII small subunit
LSEELTFEQAAEKLDEKVKLLEDGNLSLEETLKVAEEASKYLRLASELLEAAKKKVEIRPEE